MEPSVRDAFAGDHARLDRSFELFRSLRKVDFPLATVLFRAFRRELEHHMRCEEEILFAAIERRLGSRSGPTGVMHAEHRRILDALDRLEERVRARRLDSDEEEAALIELLQTHNFKEDRVLYPMIDRILGEDERRRLLAELKGVPIAGTPRCCA
jgi:regulator of cell morphogenesis and NO signaling